MIRARFHVNAKDYRPVEWPIQHPYWCTGYGDDHAVIVAYADNVEQIQRLWPDATNIVADDATEYFFNDRFPKPVWFQEAAR